MELRRAEPPRQPPGPRPGGGRGAHRPAGGAARRTRPGTAGDDGRRLQGRRRLPAAGPGPPGPAPGGHPRTQPRPGSGVHPGIRGPGPRAAGRTQLRPASAPAGVGRGAGGRGQRIGPRHPLRSAEPRLHHLHLRLHRAAEGGDGRAGRHAQQPAEQGALPGAERSRRDRPDRLAELRYLGVAVPHRAALWRRGGHRPQRHRPRPAGAAGACARTRYHRAGKRALADPGHARRRGPGPRRPALDAAHR
ncbi:hypothetical protein D9M69_375640 [compost metagenome]